LANPKHAKVFQQGIDAWNRWRYEHRRILPDLSGLSLRRANLLDWNLVKAKMSQADLVGANLFAARLEGADLSGAILNLANLSKRSADLLPKVCGFRAAHR
jgi:hypothetical protein